MHDQDKAIVKALVPVAWADGIFADKEKETIEALLDAFDASDDERKELRTYAQEKRSLDDIPIQDLSADDRRVLLQHAVLLSFVDGDQGAEERAFLDALVERLKIPAQEAGAIRAYAESRARRLLKLL